MNTSQPPEAARDQEVSAFTPILRRVWSSTPTVLAVAFADMTGECVDYVSSLEPFDAKVSAAHALILMSRLLESVPKLGGGAPLMFELSADQRDLWARRVSEEYVLVVVTEAGADPAVVRPSIVVAVDELRAEAGIGRPTWEPAPDGVLVETRTAVGWAYAPSAYRVDGARIRIEAVMGRWLDGPEPPASKVVCFRVRTDRNEEVTLAHDMNRDLWMLRGAE